MTMHATGPEISQCEKIINTPLTILVLQQTNLTF